MERAAWSWAVATVVAWAGAEGAETAGDAPTVWPADRASRDATMAAALWRRG
ncbi:hypothetical protein GCM10023335_53450 [Streptomyces siamensis]|uniref:Uncharacterized protein n=1 Tax=Streptomyces siamensis TaxID=1274986 RepID=A0ABP9J949_9ACTN